MADKSAKGQKIGRNTRAPTNAMQKTRCERNKRLRAEKAHAIGMKQPHGGQSTVEMYQGAQSRVDSAAKRLSACMALGDARRSRIGG